MMGEVTDSALGGSGVINLKLCTIFSGKQRRYLEISLKYKGKSSDFSYFKKLLVKMEKNTSITLRLEEKIDIIE